MIRDTSWHWYCVRLAQKAPFHRQALTPCVTYPEDTKGHHLSLFRHYTTFSALNLHKRPQQILSGGCSVMTWVTHTRAIIETSCYFSDVMGTGVSKVLCPSLISLYFNVYMLQLIFTIQLMCHICPYLKH